MLNKLAHRVNLIWMLMLVPLLAVSVVAGIIIFRLPGLTETFITSWHLQRQSDSASARLTEARQIHVVMEEGNKLELHTPFVQATWAAIETLASFKASEPSAELKSSADSATAAVTQYRESIDKLSDAMGQADLPELEAQIGMLRADSREILDPTFRQATDLIVDMVQTFDCDSLGRSSRELRRDIEILEQRLDSNSLLFESLIRIQNNINNIRGSFATLVLACQELERAKESGHLAYQYANATLSNFQNDTNRIAIDRVERYIAREVELLAGLTAPALIVLIGGIVVAVGFSNKFGRQLMTMTETIRRIALGDRDISVPFLGSSDEFGEIATHVDRFRLNAIHLEDAMITARNSNEAKSLFLATVSHELRTPLNAILGFSEIISRGIVGPLPPVYRDYANDIYLSGQTLLAQISQILDLSKIELGQIDPQKSNFNVVGTIRLALRRLERKINDKAIAVDWNPKQSAYVFGDQGHMLQIITNILDNAVKYNHSHGRITVSVRSSIEEVVVSVSDTGVGMNAHEVDRAHEPFVQFAGSRDSLQGVGLGLSIVARLLEVNAGKLRIRSEKNVGTTVDIVVRGAETTSVQSVA